MSELFNTIYKNVSKFKATANYLIYFSLNSYDFVYDSYDLKASGHF